MQNSNTNDREVVDERFISFAKKCFYKGFEKCKNDDANCFTAWREEAAELLSGIEPLRINTEELGKVKLTEEEAKYFTELLSKQPIQWQFQNQALPLTDELVSLFEEYIKLLGNELDELAVMASNRGWKSTRFEQGKELREKIANAKANRGSGFTLEDELLKFVEYLRKPNENPVTHFLELQNKYGEKILSDKSIVTEYIASLLK